MKLLQYLKKNIIIILVLLLLLVLFYYFIYKKNSHIIKEKFQHKLCVLSVFKNETMNFTPLHF